MSVGEVVLNRVAHSDFPGTIREVVYQPGQYYGAQSRYFENLRPDGRCVGLKRLLEGERVLNDPAVVFQANFKQGGAYIRRCTIGIWAGLTFVGGEKDG